MTPEEEWRAVVGYEGYYEVSSLGRVRSIDRVVPDSRGWTRRYKGKVLVGAKVLAYIHVVLAVGGEQESKRIHSLVAEAFIGPRPDGMVVCHRDNDGTNNAVSNLRYDTQRANIQQASAEGRMSRTHCKRGHEFTPENTWLHSAGSQGVHRICIACHRIRKAAKAA